MHEYWTSPDSGIASSMDFFENLPSAYRDAAPGLVLPATAILRSTTYSTPTAFQPQYNLLPSSRSIVRKKSQIRCEDKTPNLHQRISIAAPLIGQPSARTAVSAFRITPHPETPWGAPMPDSAKSRPGPRPHPKWCHYRRCCCAARWHAADASASRRRNPNWAVAPNSDGVRCGVILAAAAR